MTMYNVDASELIEELSKELQKVDEVKATDWASMVKTGASRERPPVREDWWYVRAASVLRKVRLLGPIGVSKLRTIYGGKKNKGHKPEEFRRASGNILRKILQQLEKAELIKKDKKGVHKGRVITPKGIKLIDGVAKKIIGSRPVEKPKVEEKKEAPKQEKVKVEAKKEEKPKVEEKPKAEEKPKEAPKKEEKPAEKPKEAPKEEKAPAKVEEDTKNPEQAKNG